MSKAKSRQPLISEVYDLTNISSNPMTPSLNTTNLNQTFDNSKKIKKRNLNKGSCQTNNPTLNNTLANTKEEMIQEFIQSEKYHEQQKELKLNEMKNQKRLLTNTTLQKVPEIDPNSNSIAQDKNNKPIYDRVNEVTQKKQENIETLRSLYIKTLKDDQPSTKAKAFTGYSKKTMKWVKKQDDWLKKKHQSQNQNQLTDMSHNQISELNQRILPTQSTNKMLTKDMNSNITKSNLNLKRELMRKETNPSFTPTLNRNRSETSKLYPDYIPLNPKKRRTKSNQCKTNTSVEALPIKKDIAKPKCEHWSSLLHNLQKSKHQGNDNDNEYMYRINIYPSGAWNENSLNNVNMNGQTKKIISHLLS